MSGEHYKSGIETIAVMEQVMTQPGELPAKERMLVAQAIKYLLRAGVKANVPWHDDMLKALDYVFRAVHGDWWHRHALHHIEVAEAVQVFRNILGRIGLDADMAVDDVQAAFEQWYQRVTRATAPRPQTPEELRQQAAELEVQAWEVESGTGRPCNPGALVRLKTSAGRRPVEGPAHPYMAYSKWYIEVGSCSAEAEHWEIL